MRLIRPSYCLLRPTLGTPSRIPSNLYLSFTLRGLSTIQTNKTTQTPTDQAKRDKIDITILKKLSGYLWPKSDEPNALQTKSRIGGALLLLLGSKVINIQVPFIFKDIIDACGTFETAAGIDPFMAVPLSIVLGYGLARSTSSLMQER